MNADERRQLIADRKQLTGRKARLWARDAWRDFDVWEVPVDGLLLNVDNRRFAAERKLMEEQLGHDLDPENRPDDETSVEAILLDARPFEVDGNRVVGKPNKDHLALKNDWIRRHQESPFWIRPDGTVRNGNRRLAMLRRMQREGGSTGRQFVDAVILDLADIDEPALFDMEQREQLTENLKVRYTDINLLLAVREGAMAHTIDWYDPDSVDRVAGELQDIIGDDKPYAVVQLNAIRCMDAYLEDSGQAGQYQKLIGQIERFRDVGRAMARIEAAYPDDAPDMLRLLFAAIRAGLPHGDIRSLRRMFLHDRERYNQLLAAVDEAEADWEGATQGEQLADPDLSVPVGDELADSEDDEDEPPGPNVPNYPRAEIADAVEVALDGFSASSSDDALKTLRQVLNRLEVLTDERRQLERALEGDHRDDVILALAAIIAWADAQRSHLGG